MELHYKTYSDFLAEHLSGKVQKIAVHGGFTCPNRDGKVGTRGCAFCDNRSFVPAYCHDGDGVGEQLRKGIAFFSRKYPHMQYIAYFQAYSNTYAPLKVLQQRYEEALSVDGVVGLVVATRPDCLPEDVLDYLQELSERTFLQVELGIETVHDRNLQLIGRGHDYACSVDAVHRLSACGISVGAHIILGLPGETYPDFLSQATRLSDLPLSTLKLHQLQILRHTPMAVLYAEHPELFWKFTPQSYASLILDYIALLPKSIAFDRFLNQSPPDMLAVPGWGIKNYQFSAILKDEFRRRDISSLS